MMFAVAVGEHTWWRLLLACLSGLLSFASVSYLVHEEIMEEEEKANQRKMLRNEYLRGLLRDRAWSEGRGEGRIKI